MNRKGKWPSWAWLVHFHTASGAVLAFLATLATFEDAFRTAFILLIASTLVDATDGLAARWARVKEVTPGFDGARLDDIVDYLTFVFVPLLILYRAGHLPAGWGLAVCAAVLLSSGYGFASLDAKTDDYFFTGFPSYWNIVVLYLLLFGTSPRVNALVLLALSALVFVRIGYVYPSRTPTLRSLTLALGAIWAVQIAVIIALWPSPPRWVSIGSLAFPVYYVVLSLVLHARRVTGPAGLEGPAYK
jgi:phosphatidylcholine synthase